MSTGNYSHVKRYDALDRYTIEELKNEYNSRNTREKISYLEKISKKYRGGLPEPLEELAVSEKDLTLRRWLARNVDLNSKKAEKLYKDEDELVRACMYERQYSAIDWGDKLVNFFNKLSLIEKLALVRNPFVASELIELVFDYYDKKLKITSEERRQLVEAYLTNPRETDKHRRERLEYLDISSPASSLNHYRILWEEIGLWPEQSINFFTVFENLDDYAGIKLEIYKSMKTIHQKNALIQSCNGYGDADADLLRLAFNDENKSLRQSAYSKAFLDQSEFEEIIGSNDKEVIMFGLAYNENLNYAQLNQLSKKLSELGDYSGAQQSRLRMEKLENIQENLN